MPRAPLRPPRAPPGERGPAEGDGPRLPGIQPLTGFLGLVRPEVLGGFRIRLGARYGQDVYKLEDEEEPFTGGQVVRETVVIHRVDVQGTVCLADTIEIGVQVPAEIFEVTPTFDTMYGPVSVTGVDLRLGDVATALKLAGGTSTVRVAAYGVVELPTGPLRWDPRFLPRPADTDRIAWTAGAALRLRAHPIDIVVNGEWFANDGQAASAWRAGLSLTPLPFVTLAAYGEVVLPDASIDPIASVAGSIQLWFDPVYFEFGGSGAVVTSGLADLERFRDAGESWFGVSLGFVFDGPPLPSPPPRLR